ncbi:MAG: hypothetical protein R3E64_04045 [Halioglobus sp.]
MPEFAPQIHPISRKEKRTLSVDCRGNLEGSSVIIGAPTITEFGSAHLTIADQQVSTSTLVINGDSVAAGKAIIFSVDARGGSVRRNHTYQITLEFDTDVGERVAGGVRLRTD